MTLRLAKRLSNGSFVSPSLHSPVIPSPVSLVCVILFTAISTLAFVTISLYWHGYKLKKLGSVASSASDHGKARLAWTTGILVTLCFVELVPTGLLIGLKEC